MKILELRFKNLNSLQGEWLIDFTKDDYIEDGIFALIGPTGSGKSTILDAICLALYGETPRLGKITKNDNEIMSRQTGECYAEVVFQSQMGTFRCHWEQRRARKAVSGNLQDPEHQIAEADSGDIIESQRRSVLSAIELRTGMNFDRFKRSILLAQGSFDSFLKSNIGDKSEILEQITGTEIYSNISKRVYEKQKVEREILNQLEKDIGGITLLSNDEIMEKKVTLAHQKSELSVKKISQYQQDESIAWLKELALLKDETQQIHEQKILLAEALEAFVPQRIILKKALKAEQINSEFVELKAIRLQQEKDNERLVHQMIQLPKTLDVLNQGQEQWLQTQKQYQSLQDEQTRWIPIWRAARSLDQSLKTHEKALQTIQSEVNGIHQSITTVKASYQQSSVDLLQSQEQMSAVTQYLHDSQNDEWLIRGLAGIEAQLKQLSTAKKSQENKQSIRQTLQLEIEKHHHHHQKLMTKFKQQMEIVSTAKDDVHNAQKQLETLLAGRLLREYQEEKDQLLIQKSLLQRIASYEAMRKQLEDGQACPLCGALEHPYAKGNVPELDVVDHTIKKLELTIQTIIDQQAVCDDSDKKLVKAQAVLSIDEITVSQSHERHEQRTLQLTALNAEIKDIISSHQALKHSIEICLGHLGIHHEFMDGDELLKQLQERLSQWQKYQKQCATIQTTMTNLTNEMEKSRAVLEKYENDLIQKRNQSTTLTQEYEALRTERTILLEDDDVDGAEQKLSDQVKQSHEELEAQRFVVNHLEKEHARLVQDIETLQKSIEERTAQLAQFNAQFESAVKSVGFSDEAEFISAILPQPQRLSLENEAKLLDDQLLVLDARLQDRTEKLSLVSAKQLTVETLDVLLPKKEMIEAEIQDLIKTTNGIEFELLENDQKVAKVAKQKVAIDAQRAVYDNWYKLYTLIGSADGKKYRNFAQGLTFEMMIKHANQQLSKMTDRYLLMRDDKEPLALNVIDHYQAGEVRSTKNLSGGESFIISLALALGLSKMASQKVRVDSLFLDEGFGTLDEDALDMALDTLSNLKNEGKLIGVISHVSALKDRIATQIKVSPLSGGKSKISGPGCQKLS